MKINLQEWFKQGILKDRWKEPGWIVKCFAVTKLPNVNDIVVSVTSPPQPHELYVGMNGDKYCYWDGDKSEFIEIDNSDITEPLLKYSDSIILNKGDLPNVASTITTTYGNVIINLYCCVYAFGSKIPFFTGKLNGKEIESKVISLLASDPQDVKPHEVTPAEVDQYKKAVSALSAFSPICVSSGSKASFTVRKELLEMRDKLLEENKSRLNDPAIVSIIEKKLVEKDRELNKGDVSESYFAADEKLRVVGRKRSKIMYGVEGGLDGKLITIPKSLSEGLNYATLPQSADVITSASQSRGLLTAQGGELVKYNLRIFQNTTIAAEDCGTKGYLSVTVAEDNSKWLENRLMFSGDKTVVITKDLLSGLIGKTIKLRSPGYCLTPDGNFCKSCVDINLAKRPNGIAVGTSAGTSKIMMDAMKAMHGRQNDTFLLQFDKHIS